MSACCFDLLRVQERPGHVPITVMKHSKLPGARTLLGAPGLTTRSKEQATNGAPRQETVRPCHGSFSTSLSKPFRGQRPGGAARPEPLPLEKSSKTTHVFCKETPIRCHEGQNMPKTRPLLRNPRLSGLYFRHHLQCRRSPLVFFSVMGTDLSNVAFF